MDGAGGLEGRWTGWDGELRAGPELPELNPPDDEEREGAEKPPPPREPPEPPDPAEPPLAWYSAAEARRKAAPKAAREVFVKALTVAMFDS